MQEKEPIRGHVPTRPMSPYVGAVLRKRYEAIVSLDEIPGPDASGRVGNPGGDASCVGTPSGENVATVIQSALSIERHVPCQSEVVLSLSSTPPAHNHHLTHECHSLCHLR